MVCMMEIPDVLSYPNILDVEDVPEIAERYVYAIRGYELSGVTVLAFIKDDQIGIRVGDWDGNVLDPRKLDDKYHSYINKISKLMYAAKIAQAQFYFSGYTLVDIRTSVNQFVGPGMIKDLCENIMQTQEVISIGSLNEEFLAGLREYNYIILKHSSFKIIIRENEAIPLYAIVRSSNGQNTLPVISSEAQDI